MSYEIYKTIKQLDDGCYRVTSKSSNVTGGGFSPWTMTYYKEKYPSPEYNKKQRDAIFAIMSLYHGSVFYPEKYKRMQTIAQEWNNDYHARFPEECPPADYIMAPLSEKAYYDNGGMNVYSAYIAGYNEKVKAVLDDFFQYCKTNPSAEMIQAVIRLETAAHEYLYILSINKRKFYYTRDPDKAHVYSMARCEMENMIKRIPKTYTVEIIPANKT